MPQIKRIQLYEGDKDGGCQFKIVTRTKMALRLGVARNNLLFGKKNITRQVTDFTLVESN